MIPEPPMPPVSVDAPSEPLGTLAVGWWRARYQLQIAQATAGGYRALVRRLIGFGRWTTVTVDTILLVIAELILGIILAILAFGIVFLHGNYLNGGVGAGAAMNRAGTDLTNWLSSPVGLGLSALITQAGIFLILQLRVIGPGLLSWSEIGFGPALRSRPLRAFALGLGLGLAVFVVGDVLLLGMQAIGLPVQGQQQELKSVHHASALSFLFFAATAAITAPIAEETFFRAYAMRAMAVRYGFPVGAIVSSILFGLLHLIGGVGLVALPLMVI
ncbi:MAG TPA: type II CAAX endopeptidase family protein, partial [Chloroflexota bacterium]|nr:type II CAAX endopeptidase family protein [Chloroflexota bacterium]